MATTITIDVRTALEAALTKAAVSGQAWRDAYAAFRKSAKTKNIGASLNDALKVAAPNNGQRQRDGRAAFYRALGQGMLIESPAVAAQPPVPANSPASPAPRRGRSSIFEFVGAETGKTVTQHLQGARQVVRRSTKRADKK